MTLTNVRWLLDRDGQLTITLPTGHASPDDLAQALEPAALATPLRKALNEGSVEQGRRVARIWPV